jgi:hypothetical protein
VSCSLIDGVLFYTCIHVSQVVAYTNGQQFKVHHDAGTISSSDELSEEEEEDEGKDEDEAIVGSTNDDRLTSSDNIRGEDHPVLETNEGNTIVNNTAIISNDSSSSSSSSCSSDSSYVVTSCKYFCPSAIHLVEPRRLVTL